MRAPSKAVSTLQKNTLITRVCPACGWASQVFKFRKHGSDIYQCTACGLGSASIQNFDPSSYYTGDYFRGGQADGYADYLGAEPILRREFAKTVQFIRRHRPAGKLLELGCAYGFFLLEASEHYDTSGIELAREAAEHCRAKGLKVIHGNIDRSTAEKLGTQDVIVMLDVIEHLADPSATLELCVHRLNPGGIILITTGDFGSAVAKTMGKAWRLMTPPQHLWYFTQASMHRMAARYGLRVEHIDHPWKLVPLSLIGFQVKRMVGLGGVLSNLRSSLGVPVNFFDAMRVVLRKP